MRKFCMVSLCCFAVIFSSAQEAGVDSKGEPVFQFYSTENATLQFNRRSPLSASYVFGSKSNAMRGTLVQFTVLNSGDFPLLEKLKDIRPGAGIKLGFQNTTGQIPNIDPAKRSRAWGVNAFFNVDNIKLYDTIERVSAKKYPVIWGIEGQYTLFFKNKNQSSAWRKALSIYTAVSSSWNDHNLLSYQEISKVSIRPDVVTMRDFDGRYGVLNGNFFKSRTAVSFPLFYKRLNLIPYWVGIFGTQNSPSYHMGAVTNLLSSSLNQPNTKMPSTFGIGFDWVYATEHLPAKVNVFVKATVGLGKL